jgi:hypothetical protein
MKLWRKLKKTISYLDRVLCFDPLDHKSAKELHRHLQIDYCEEIKGEIEAKRVLADRDGKHCRPAADTRSMDMVIRMELPNFRSFDGATFNPETNPLVQTAIELAAYDRLKPEDSALFRHCAVFQPRSYGEVVNIGSSSDIATRSQYLDFRPWSESRPRLLKRSGTFGPKDISYVKHNIIRLRNLLSSFRRYSYLTSPRYIVKGYLLKRSDQQRFVIVEGHHRIAALAALDYLQELDASKISASLGNSRAWRNRKLIFCREGVLEWPGVKNDFISSQLAKTIFDNYFFGKTGLR